MYSTYFKCHPIVIEMPEKRKYCIGTSITTDFDISQNISRVQVCKAPDEIWAELDDDCEKNRHAQTPFYSLTY